MATTQSLPSEALTPLCVRAAPTGWVVALHKIQSALEAVIQLLQNTADSSVVMAIMAGRFSAGYKGVAQILSQALHGGRPRYSPLLIPYNLCQKNNCGNCIHPAL